MKKCKFNVKVLAEIAIFAALAFALDMLQGGIWKGVFINGGSIGLAMIPIFIISYRRGIVPGILCGFIVSLVQMLGGIYVINASNYTGFLQVFSPFAQIMLDYVLAYTVVGAAGAFAWAYSSKKSLGWRMLWMVVGVTVGGLLKYAMHVMSGAFFWLAPGETLWGLDCGSVWYSFVYNGAYCLPNIVISIAVMAVIVKVYPSFLDPEEKNPDAELDDAEETNEAEATKEA